MNRSLLSFLLLLCMSVIIELKGQQSIAIKVYLEGAVLNNGGQLSATGKPLMRDNLRKNPFTNDFSLPARDPYYYPMTNFDISQNFLHVEGGNMPSLHTILNYQSVFSVIGDNAIVDWVHVQIRSAIDSTVIIATRSGLLQRDGDIVDLDGVSSLNFANLTASNYYVVVKHRMHLGVMSKLINAGQSIDFTSPQTPTYDFGYVNSELDYTGLSQNDAAISGYKVMWGGDLNGDGLVKISGPNEDGGVIFADILGHQDNTGYLSAFDAAIGYYNSDIDMNGKSKYTSPNDDLVLIMAQTLSYPQNKKLILNYSLLKEQVPSVKP